MATEVTSGIVESLTTSEEGQQVTSGVSEVLTTPNEAQQVRSGIIEVLTATIPEGTQTWSGIIEVLSTPEPVVAEGDLLQGQVQEVFPGRQGTALSHLSGQRKTTY